MATLTRKDIAKAIAGNGHSAAEITAILQAAEHQIQAALCRGDKVQLWTFGRFVTRDFAARSMRDPINGAPVHIPARRRVRFEPHTALAALVAPLRPAAA